MIACESFQSVADGADCWRNTALSHCFNQIDSDSAGPLSVSRQKRTSERDAMSTSQKFSSSSENLNGESFLFITIGSRRRVQLWSLLRSKRFHSWWRWTLSLDCILTRLGTPIVPPVAGIRWRIRIPTFRITKRAPLMLATIMSNIGSAATSNFRRNSPRSTHRRASW